MSSWQERYQYLQSLLSLVKNPSMHVLGYQEGRTPNEINTNQFDLDADCQQTAEQIEAAMARLLAERGE